MNTQHTPPFPLQSMHMHQPVHADAATLITENFLPPGPAAQVLGLSVKTLATWRCTGRYALPYYRVGGRIRYARADLDAWLAARLHTRTTEPEVAQ